MTNDPKVLTGQDGYLFLSAGRHNVSAFFTGEKQAHKGSVRNFVRNIHLRNRICAKHDLPYSAFIFPEKFYALRSYLSNGDTLSSLYLRDYEPALTEMTESAVRYPISLLDEAPEYFTKTDTHFSTLGAAAVTRDFLAKDLPDTVSAFDAVIKDRIIERADFCGDLGRKMTPPQKETTTGFDDQGLPVVEVASNGVETGNDGLIILLQAEQAITDKTLLIFGDSFFRQLLPLLALVFKKIVFCRTRFFHRELLAAVDPDVIWSGQAERYLSSCQLDSERPHFLAYPLVRGKTLTPDANFAALWQDMVQQDKFL